ncbi:hypothetical protein [Lysinibacter cavernae]|uniref:LPXTG cell wall anchor domain-containing protein n=1 Tax=Lysinibacter cavernae TaxID=1640652 RepID=A0A7X5R1R8_9MICO|nr:hypothetical protein [Lysinibacter cavernae]NIH53852.1 hypothetical protein [Lysinibacter cavernae]
MKLLAKSLLGLTVSSVIVFSGAAAASAVERDLIDVPTGNVSVSVPAPGHDEQWGMTVNNLTDSELPVGLKVTGDATSPIFSGDAQLSVRLVDSAGKEIMTNTNASELLDKTFTLPSLGAKGTYSLVGTASLPVTAGNEYQLQGSAITFRFTTELDDAVVPPLLPPAEVPRPNAPSPLTLTGTELATYLVLAGTLMFFGYLLLRRRRETVVA